MKTLAFILSLLFAAIALQAHADCVPGPGQAAFFVDAPFKGACSIRGIGDYPTATSTGLPNDSISSIRLGANTRVYICVDELFGGACETITQDVSFLGGHPVGNDRITSFKVQPIAAPATCTPGNGEISFFIDANFAGSCVTRGVGIYPTAQQVGLPNDSISSIRVGTGAQAYICRDDHFQGPCEVIASDVAFLGGHSVGNDQVTSVKVQPAGTAEDCAPGGTEVAFFKDSGFKGPCVVRGLGAYPTADAIGLPNDSISSVRLGSGAQAIVCRDTSYGGDCVKLASDVSDMSGTRIGNDSISSAKVQVRGAQDCAPGANQVAFFVHSGFVAPCSVRGLGAYPTAGDIGLPNDSISSILVGTGAQAVLCVDVNYHNDCQAFRQNVSDLATQRIGTDRVSSAKVQAAGTVECNPGATEVAFFEHSDLVAPCTVHGIGDYPSAQSIGLPNDSLSSVRVGSGAQVVLCVDTDFGGDCQKLTGTFNMGSTRIGNDSVTSARVQTLGTKDCPETASQASLYVNSDFVGPCVTKGVGDYPNAAAIGLDDNSISSISVGSSVQVCACEAANFGNVCETFTGDSGSLSGHFPSLGGGNDVISSVRVQSPGQACKAVQVPPTGYSQIEVSNSHSEQHTVNIWMRDDTIGGSYLDQGTQASNWSNGTCPVGAPKVIMLKDQHVFDFVIVDPAWCGGHNDPSNLGCQKGTFGPIRGQASGPSLPYQVN